MQEISESSIDRCLSDFLTNRSGLDDLRRQSFGAIIRGLSEAMREGHTCLELDEPARDIMASSRLVSGEADLPLVLHGSRLYLARYFSYESRLVRNLKRIAAVSYRIDDLDVLLDHCFPVPAGETDYQREAARCALCRELAIIAGGPGTGKTATIARIIGLLLLHFGPDLRIALAAPTGKAAIRMGESISSLIPQLPFPDEVRQAIGHEPVTLHRLLGMRRFGSGFRHDRQNPLPWDVVLVDEASMVDLALMSKLVDALRQNSRLVLLGDKDQLASVESGAVLADCIAALPGNVVELEKSFRFDRDIGAFAAAVNRGDFDTVWRILDGGGTSPIAKAPSDWLERIGSIYATYMAQALAAVTPDDCASLFEQFPTFQVLCAVKHGKRGVRAVNARVESYLAQHGYPVGNGAWYPGRPLIITRNDYAKGLFNGDIGLCLPDPGRQGAFSVWFEQSGGGLRSFPAHRLPACETVWAMTVHKSQGSEFEEVFIVLPDQDNRVLCRELLYTAVTRARKRVTILGEKEVCIFTVSRKTKRYSGLATRLAASTQP